MRFHARFDFMNSWRWQRKRIKFYALVQFLLEISSLKNIFSELCVLEELDLSVKKVLAATTPDDDMVLKLNWQIEWLTKSSVDGQHNVPHVVIVVDQGFLCSKKGDDHLFFVGWDTLKSQAATQSFKALEDEEKITLGHSEKSIWREVVGAGFGFSLRVSSEVVRIIVFFRRASTKI